MKGLSKKRTFHIKGLIEIKSQVKDDIFIIGHD
jgi:hypothetical protein